MKVIKWILRWPVPISFFVLLIGFLSGTADKGVSMLLALILIVVFLIILKGFHMLVDFCENDKKEAK